MRDYNGHFPFIKVIKSKKKKLALTSFCCLGQETWLYDSWKLICIKQSGFYNLFTITSKYCSIFNNKPPASWVAHITMDFLTYYSCSYYSSMVLDSFYIKHASLSRSLFHKVTLRRSYGKMLSWQRFYIMAILSSFSVLDYMLKFWGYIFQNSSG